MNRLLDIILGRTKPMPSKPEGIFAMATAYVTLTVQLNVKPGTRAGVTFRPVGSSDFQKTEADLRRLLQIGAGSARSIIDVSRDNFGFQWVVVEDEDFEDLVSAIYTVSSALQDAGFNEQLLAAAFRFEAEGKPLYWIYNYKRGKYYPFAPTGNHERDNGLELRMRAVMEKELPVETNLQQWYALWDLPV
jgi:hypothetical protein